MPIVVGVTGHRDIPAEDVAALEAACGDFFGRLRRQYPATPLRLLSMLAEGADRIAARAALRMQVGLIAPLPLPAGDYLDDFTTDASRREFEELLASADRSFVVAGGPLPAPHAARPECYARAGAFIVRNCEILLALWDGGTSGKEGGTDQIVEFKLAGIPARYGDATSLDLVEPLDAGLVCRIAARREGGPADTADTADLFTMSYLSTPAAGGSAADAAAPGQPARARVEQVCARIDELNRDAAALPGDRVAASRRSLTAGFGDDLLDRDALATSAVYAVADTLAQRFQARARSALIALVWTVFFSVLAFELWAHDVWPEPCVLLSYILLLFGAYRLHRFADTRRFHTKYLDYRALAEGLRVQFYWRMAGLADSVSDHYISQQRGELEWIRTAIRRHDAFAGPAAASRSSTERRIETVIDTWVSGQCAFFRRALARDHAVLAAWETRIRWLVGLGMFAAVGTFGAAAMGALNRYRPHLVLGMALLPLVAALLHGYIEKQAFSSHVKRYGHILFVYVSAQERLAKARQQRDWEQARSLLRALGGEALEENGDWVLLHRDRPLEVPHAG